MSLLFLVLFVGEFELLRLHYLFRLRELQLTNACAYDIHVSFISQEAFLEHYKTMQNAAIQPLKARTRAADKDLTGRWTLLNFDADECPALGFAAVAGSAKACGRKTGNMFFRHCKSVQELTQGAAPIRALQCTSLQLASGLAATPSEQESALERFCLWMTWEQNQHHAPVCVPPASWDHAAERKHSVYEVFSEFMIKTRWVEVPLDAFGFLCDEEEILSMIETTRKQIQAMKDKRMRNFPPNHESTPAACLALAAVDKVVEELLSNQPNGTYYVKGKTNKAQTRRR